VGRRSGAALHCGVAGAGNPVDDAPARELADRMAEAASAWLDSLDPQQREVGEHRAALHA
jgi:hypothetical protein